MAERRSTVPVVRLIASATAAKTLTEPSLMATWSDLLPNDASEIAKAGSGSWELPELTEEGKEDLLARYHAVITAIGTTSGFKSVWWYTWTSSRDRSNSRTLEDMELLARFEKACSAGIPDDLVVLTRDPYMAPALRKLFSRHGIKHRSGLNQRLAWLARKSKMRVAPFVFGLRVCRHAFLVRHRTRKVKIVLEKKARRASERSVLVTWMTTKNLSELTPPTDTFFGRLPEILASDDRSLVVFGDLLDGIPSPQTRRIDDSLSPVCVMGKYVTNWDLVRSYVVGLWSSPVIPDPVRTQEVGLEPLIKRDIHANRTSMVYGLLLESALGRLIKDLQPDQIVHMCENNPWERACSRAAAAADPMPRVIGYMHCAVLLSHTKIVISEQEKSVRPRPSTIICTGTRARDLMVKFGGHSPDEVLAGCALRHEYLGEMTARGKLRKPLRNILVVLEGLPSMSQLVKVVFEALNDHETYRTVIRPHPAYPLHRTLNDAGLNESDFQAIEVSKNQSIMDDFQEADLVVYKGSTGALEAGYIGIPLVHFKQPDILTDDPLFEIDSLKETVTNSGELLEAIHRLSDMDDGIYLEQHQILRRYIDDYLSMPTPDNTAAFLSV